MSKIIRAGTHGKSRDLLRPAIENRQDFTTGGALWGTTEQPLTTPGHLGGADLDTFRQDRPTITYTVYSYATPIFWVNADGRTHRVAQRFSVTTSKHLGFCPRGDNELDN